jgi:hypothetical protein
MILALRSVMEQFKSIFVIGLFFIQSLASATGGVTSNGGDSIAAEFTKIARQITQVLRTHDNLPVSADAFEEAVARTWVVSKKNTFLHGIEMEAINYPTERRIEINRSRWLENKDSMKYRYVLVTHEYLGILGIDDSRYQISEKLFEIPGVARYTIRCNAFEDKVFNFNNDGDFFLELNIYDFKPIALVKNKQGNLLKWSSIGIGDAFITGSLEREPTALVSINLGFFVRMVQLPIGRQLPGKFTALSWDVKTNANSSPILKINCQQFNW